MGAVMRREFTRNQREQIVERAKTNGVVHCEGCGLALKPGAWEVDHIIPEALRPAADKQAKLTIAEGQLLGKCCHRGEDGKTNKDVTQIAKAKRQYDKAHGLKRPKQSIPGRSFPPSEKAERRQTKQPLPPRPLFAPQEKQQ